MSGGLPMRPADQADCRCRWGKAPAVRWQGFDMGGQLARLSTTPGCPHHDSCREFTKAYRATQPRGDLLYCPTHPRSACPDAPKEAPR